jgi:hypothetical protein
MFGVDSSGIPSGRSSGQSLYIKLSDFSGTTMTVEGMSGVIVGSDLNNPQPDTMKSNAQQQHRRFMNMADMAFPPSTIVALTN